MWAQKYPFIRVTKQQPDIMQMKSGNQGNQYAMTKLLFAMIDVNSYS